jgi:hypothetical protein
MLVPLAAACLDYRVNARADGKDVEVEPEGGVDPGVETGAAGTDTASGWWEEGAPTTCDPDYTDATLVTVESLSRRVIELDPDDARATEIAPLDEGIDAESNATSATFRSDGLAFVADSGHYRLLLLDPCTGATRTIGDTSAGVLCGISWGPGGHLYGLDATAGNLVRLDRANGAADPVGPLGLELSTCGLAWDCLADELVGLDGRTGRAFRVDASSGVAYDAVETEVEFVTVGVEFDPRDSTLLAINGTSLYRVNPTTGSAEELGSPSGTGRWDDLAYLLGGLRCE